MMLRMQEYVVGLNCLISHQSNLMDAVHTNSPAGISQSSHERDDIIWMIAKGCCPFSQHLCKDLWAALRNGVLSTLQNKKLSTFDINFDKVRNGIGVASPLIHGQGAASNTARIVSTCDIHQTCIHAMVRCNKEIADCICV